MKKLADAVQGDTHSPQTITWENQNLTAATITAVKQNLDTRDITAVTGTLTVTNGAGGIFTWTYSEADTGTAGRYLVQFRASYGAQADATMRASWYVELLLSATVVAAPPLVGIGPDEAAWLDAATPGGALGTAAYAATGDFDAAGSAATVQGNLTTHVGATTGAHGSTAIGDSLRGAVDAAAARTAIGVESPAVAKARFAGLLQPAGLSYIQINSAYTTAVGSQPGEGSAATILHGGAFYHAVFGDEKWRLFDMDSGALVALVDYLEVVKALNPIGYWPMDEASGSTAIDNSGSGHNGVYTGVTLGQSGIGDGRTAPSWPGTTAHNNVYSTSFRDAFNEAVGSVSLFAAASSAGIWTDSTTKMMLTLRVDGNNHVQIYKASSNHITFEYRAGGVLSAFGSSSTGHLHLRPDDAEWHHYGIAWNKAEDRVIVYWHGGQAGPPQTSLGTWVGDISSTESVIGALTTSLFFWSGRIAHVAVFDYEMTAAQMKQAAGIYQRDTLLAFGDSITAGVGATAESNRWINIVRANFGNGAFRNAGLTATVLQNTVQNTVATIGGAAASNGRDTVTTRVLPYNPDWVFILYGLNDLRLNDVAFTDALFQNDLGEVVDLIIADGTPADQIIIGSPPYIPPASYALASPEYNGGSTAKHEAYRDACAAVATAKGTLYIDVYQWMIDNGGDSLVSGDGIHPNDDGYAQIAAAFLSVL